MWSLTRITAPKPRIFFPSVVGDQDPSQVIRTMGIGHILPQETPQFHVIKGVRAPLEETPQGKSSSPPQEQDASGAQAPIQEQDEVPQAPEQDEGQAQPNGDEPIIEAQDQAQEIDQDQVQEVVSPKKRRSKFELLHEEFNQVKKNLKRRDKKRH